MRRTDFYRLSGVRLPSVTECLAICGLTDFSGIPHGVVEHARQRGREVHDWCDMVDKGQISADEKADSEIEGYVAAYLRFKNESGFEVVHSEFPFINDRDRYAGTVDRLGYLRNLNEPNRPFVIDLKCVALVSEATRLQVTGYAHGIGSVCPSPSGVGMGSLQLRADGTYRLKVYDEPQDLHNWLAVVRVTHWKLSAGLAQLEE